MRDRTQTVTRSGVTSELRTCWCEFCGDGFRTAYRRNKHIEDDHAELIPYDRDDGDDNTDG